MIVPAGAHTPRRVERSWAGTRTRIALVLVLLYAAASTIGWLQRAAAAPKRSWQDEISAYDLRFKELRSALPARGVVGYLGSPDTTGPTPAEANAASLLHFRRYLLAQYALAPLLVIESTDPELVVGNFDSGTSPPPPPGFRLVQDFGNGVLLFARAGP